MNNVIQWRSQEFSTGGGAKRGSEATKREEGVESQGPPTVGDFCF